MVDSLGEVRVGHWTSPGERTGCTVVVFPEGTVASGEVRGGAPATREFELLDPRRLVEHVDAVVLTGGSAFGLATADGVVGWLADNDRGFRTHSGPVPIVVAMALFDLDPEVVRPGAQQGAEAARAATPGVPISGRVGAGAGATIGKWRGVHEARPGGLGVAVVRSGEVTVTAVVAVNAAGDIDDGSVAADIVAGRFVPPTVAESSFENTTIGVLWTNAAADKVGCRLLAESGHDGLGRALLPAHTQTDGDAIVAASTGRVDAALSTVRIMAVVAVEQAVRSVESG